MREGDQKKDRKSTYTSMNMMLISRSIGIAVRMRVLKCYIMSTLLYGCETWTISGDIMKKPEARETWFYRIKLRISWKDRLPNEKVYRRMNTHKSLLVEIAYR